MKVKVTNLLLTAIVSMFVFYACAKDSSNPASSTGDSAFSGKGSDYFPLSAGKTISLKVSGSSSEYDSLGNITSSSQISNQTAGCSMGPSATVKNLLSFPIIFNNKVSDAYFAHNNDEVDVFGSEVGSLSAVILPASLSTGKEWTMFAYSFLSPLKGKLTEALNSYTNSAGTTYQNVINVAVVYKDSLIVSQTYTDGYDKEYTKIIFDANIYFAKGVGIIGARLNDLNYISKVNYKSGAYTRNAYKHVKANGTCSAVN